MEYLGGSILVREAVYPESLPDRWCQTPSQGTFSTLSWSTLVWVSSFIFGADALVKADVSLKFGTIPPKFIAGKPVKYESPVYWYSPLQQEFCVGYYILEPLEVQTIRFLLCKAAPVVRTDVVLITAHLWQEMQILPSRSDLEFDYEEDCYCGYLYIIIHTENSYMYLS